MKKTAGLLVLTAAIAFIAGRLFQSPSTKPAESIVAASPAESLPTSSPAATADSSTPTAPAVTLPAATSAPTASTPAASATDVPSVTAATPAPTSSVNVTKNPKTLNELYRAFDTINAAAEATTPESMATLVDFAATENPDVRSAALNAIINRDDATAAPLLRKASKQLDDSKAVIALLQTADYIELPGTTMTAIAARPKIAPEQGPRIRTPLAPPAPSTP